MKKMQTLVVHHGVLAIANHWKEDAVQELKLVLGQVLNVRRHRRRKAAEYHVEEEEVEERRKAKDRGKKINPDHMMMMKRKKWKSRERMEREVSEVLVYGR